MVMSANVPRNHLVVAPSQQDYRQGSLTADVVLVEYGDFQCPQSATLNRLINSIQERIPTLCFIFRHFPQPQYHPQSQKAAEAAEAAGAQGQFWQMVDLLFAHQQALGNGYLVEYANELGLDIPRFLRDIARKEFVDRINQDVASGIQSGVTATPALFINGERYQDAVEFEPLYAAIIKARKLS
jgi:protein-disulfide isomerase